jgi:hypothetical protein
MRAPNHNIRPPHSKIALGEFARADRSRLISSYTPVSHVGTNVMLCRCSSLRVGCELSERKRMRDEDGRERAWLRHSGCGEGPPGTVSRTQAGSEVVSLAEKSS